MPLKSSCLIVHAVSSSQWYELRRDDYADDSAAYKTINIGLNDKGELIITFYVYPGPVFAAKFSVRDVAAVPSILLIKEVRTFERLSTLHQSGFSQDRTMQLEHFRLLGR